MGNGIQMEKELSGLNSQSINDRLFAYAVFAL